MNIYIIVFDKCFIIDNNNHNDRGRCVTNESLHYLQ